ncbi:REP-associated tyrosine transposase [Mucilaginibacter sp. P25]|uniref:REP element-mobilizing transposase RayT n=1 Tax=Mucilaginibacter gossypii TaxID=551996 RepID=A0A1G8MQK9_9SPHI|nr:transposase [Mucilaginibacter gossypii]SDI70137.1 REP element-mobilizing transposase RayT [Mucilaginibacter gossypii]
MSRKYKFLNKEGLYFVSFATVYWIDVFIRSIYNQIIIESLTYCQKNLGMELYCWCIMPSHIHLIYSAKNNNPEIILGRFKEYTAKQLIATITSNIQESRRDWMLWMFKRAASKSSNVKQNQFWQHHNKPIELWTAAVIEQKADYIHNNPVEAGFVTEPSYWRYSSAIDYVDGKGLIDIEFL